MLDLKAYIPERLLDGIYLCEYSRKRITRKALQVLIGRLRGLAVNLANNLVFDAAALHTPGVRHIDDFIMQF